MVYFIWANITKVLCGVLYMARYITKVLCGVLYMV